jgi:hypothetical protein
MQPSAKNAPLAQKLGKPFTHIRKLLKKTDASIPYTAVFQASETIIFPTNFSIANFPGLLFCHIVREKTLDRMITYWRDEANFQAHSPKLVKTLSLTAREGSGFVVDLQQRAIPLSERLSLKDRTLGIFALLGALLGIRDYMAVLFAVPDVAISYTDSGHLDVVEGAQITIPITVWSQVRFASANVTFTSALMHLGNTAIPLDVETGVVPSLASGQSTSIKITTAAPRHSEKQHSPDVYTLHVTATAKAGAWWPKRDIHAASREVWVWQAASSAPHPSLLRAVGDACEFNGLVYVSKSSPRGKDAEFVLNSPRGVVTEMSLTVAANSKQDKSQVDTPAVTTRKIAFRTPPFDKFQEYPYNLVLYTQKSVTQSQCEQLIAALDVNLQDPTGEK